MIIMKEMKISADEEDTTIYSESNLEGYSDWYKENAESKSLVDR